MAALLVAHHRTAATLSGAEPVLCRWKLSTNLEPAPEQHQGKRGLSDCFHCANQAMTIERKQFLVFLKSSDRRRTHCVQQDCEQLNVWKIQIPNTFLRGFSCCFQQSFWLRPITALRGRTRIQMRPRGITDDQRACSVKQSERQKK